MKYANFLKMSLIFMYDMFKRKTVLMLPGCFIPKDLGHAPHSPKGYIMECALKLGGVLQQ